LFDYARAGLPWYLQTVLPAASAFDVPVNTSILLRTTGVSDVYGWQFALRDGKGVAVELTTRSYYQLLTSTPNARLAPATQYIFSITPRLLSAALTRTSSQPARRRHDRPAIPRL